MNGVQLQVSNDSPDIAVQGEQAFLDDQAHAMRASVSTSSWRACCISRPDESVLASSVRTRACRHRRGPGRSRVGAAAPGAYARQRADIEDEFFNSVHRCRAWRTRAVRLVVSHRLSDGETASGAEAGSRRLGFERQAGIAESEDHIAALCDVMAMLIREQGSESG